MPEDTKTEDTKAKKTLDAQTLKAVNRVLEQATAKGLGQDWNNTKHAAGLAYLASDCQASAKDATKWHLDFMKALREEPAWLYASNMKKELLKCGVTKDVAAEYE